MYRNKDIEEVLFDINEKIQSLPEKSSSTQISKLMIKNTLENMRSVLDYIDKDILNELKKSNTRGRKSLFSLWKKS